MSVFARFAPFFVVVDGADVVYRVVVRGGEVRVLLYRSPGNIEFTDAIVEAVFAHRASKRRDLLIGPVRPFRGLYAPLFFPSVLLLGLGGGLLFLRGWRLGRGGGFLIVGIGLRPLPLVELAMYRIHVRARELNRLGVRVDFVLVDISTAPLFVILHVTLPRVRAPVRADVHERGWLGGTDELVRVGISEVADELLVGFRVIVLGTHVHGPPTRLGYRGRGDRVSDGSDRARGWEGK